MSENVSSTINTLVSLTRNVFLLSSVAIAALGASQSKTLNMHFLKYYAFAVVCISLWTGYATVCWFDAFIQKAQASKAIREHPSYDLVAWTRFLNILRAYMCVVVLATLAIGAVKR
jgi:hypothetical protein